MNPNFAATMKSLNRHFFDLTFAEIMIGIVMGKMNRGTVSWLNNARAENILLAVSWVSCKIANTHRVTNVTMMDEMCVSRAVDQNNTI